MNGSPGIQTKPQEPETIGTPQSSLTSYFKYDPKSLRLEVGLKYGVVLQYWPVYPQTWLDLKAAPSKGRFYLNGIKKTTSGTKIK